MKATLYGSGVGRGIVPPTRVLWRALRLARVDAEGRSVILRHIRRETPADAPLGALLVASGSIE